MAAPVNVLIGLLPVLVAGTPLEVLGTKAVVLVWAAIGVAADELGELHAPQVSGAELLAAGVVTGKAGTRPTPCVDVGTALDVAPPVTGACCVMVLKLTCGTVTVCVTIVLVSVRVKVMTVLGISAGFVGAGGAPEPPVTGTEVEGAGVGRGTRVMLDGIPVQIPGFFGTKSAQIPAR